MAPILQPEKQPDPETLAGIIISWHSAINGMAGEADEN